MLEGKISFVGFGASNKAMYEFLKGCGYGFTVRSKERMQVPTDVTLITGDSYLDTTEELIFRSPSCMPYKINGSGSILSEASVAISILNCRKIGITGSDGKTTVSTLISSILNESGAFACLGGNNGYPIINYVGRLRESDTLVCELSSFQLIDMEPSLDTAVITGVSENHLDVHSSMDEYISSKANILKDCKRAVINLDNPYSGYFIDRVPSGAELILATLDRERVGKIKDASYSYLADGKIFYNGEELLPSDAIKLKGRFNALNVCMAAGAAYPYAEKDKIRSAVEGFCGVPSRMELVRVKNGVSFYDSSIDSTPARTEATLSAFPKERVVVILGGYDKNLSYGALGKCLDGVKCAVICGANGKKILKAILGACKIRLCNSLEESVKTAYRMAEDGDFVILSPASASFDAFENYIERSEKFKETVRGL